MINENTQELVITRTFQAPRRIIFKAFTEPAHLAKWWGPKGFTMNALTLDLRPGGTFHYCMTSPEGMEMWGIFFYREIEAPERIVFVNAFSDKDGNIVRSAFSPTWPLQVLNTWTLKEEEGITTLTLRGKPLDATDEETETFNNMHAGMKQGFGGTFDQLEQYLKENSSNW